MGIDPMVSIIKDTMPMLTKLPVPYDFCVGIPWGQHLFSIVS